MDATYPYWPGRSVGNPARKAAANGNPAKEDENYQSSLVMFLNHIIFTMKADNSNFF